MSFFPGIFRRLQYCPKVLLLAVASSTGKRDSMGVRTDVKGAEENSFPVQDFGPYNSRKRKKRRGSAIRNDKKPPAKRKKEKCRQDGFGAGEQ